jgi:hypothetical protein
VKEEGRKKEIKGEKERIKVTKKQEKKPDHSLAVKSVGLAARTLRFVGSNPTRGMDVCRHFSVVYFPPQVETW